MNATELKELRKAVKKLLDQADERVVRMVHAMLKADAAHMKSLYALTPDQEAILEKRMEQYKKGQMNERVE